MKKRFLKMLRVGFDFSVKFLFVQYAFDLKKCIVNSCLSDTAGDVAYFL